MPSGASASPVSEASMASVSSASPASRTSANGSGSSSLPASGATISARPLSISLFASTTRTSTMMPSKKRMPFISACSSIRTRTHSSDPALSSSSAREASPASWPIPPSAEAASWSVSAASSLIFMMRWRSRNSRAASMPSLFIGSVSTLRTFLASSLISLIGLSLKF